MSRPLIDTMVSHTHDGCLNVPLAWKLFDIVFLLIGLVAVWFSVKKNNNPRVRLFLCMSWILLAFGVLTSAYFGHWIMYTASFLLVSTHFYNLKYGGFNSARTHAQ